MTRDNENKIKKFLNDLRIFEAELNIIFELQKEADSLMREPGTWKMVRRRSGEMYADALNRSLVFIGKVETAFKDLDIEDMREDLRDIEKDKELLKELNIKDEKPIEEKASVKEEVKETKPIKNEEMIILDTKEKRTIYNDIFGKTGVSRGSMKGKWVRKYNRITVDALISEMELMGTTKINMGTTKIKKDENDKNNLTEQTQVKNLENKDVLADEDIPKEN